MGQSSFPPSPPICLPHTPYSRPLSTWVRAVSHRALPFVSHTRLTADHCLPGSEQFPTRPSHLSHTHALQPTTAYLGQSSLPPGPPICLPHTPYSRPLPTWVRAVSHQALPFVSHTRHVPGALAGLTADQCLVSDPLHPRMSGRVEVLTAHHCKQQQRKSKNRSQQESITCCYMH